MNIVCTAAARTCVTTQASRCMQAAGHRILSHTHGRGSGTCACLRYKRTRSYLQARLDACIHAVHVGTDVRRHRGRWWPSSDVSPSPLIADVAFRMICCCLGLSLPTAYFPLFNRADSKNASAVGTCRPVSRRAGYIHQYGIHTHPGERRARMRVGKGAGRTGRGRHRLALQRRRPYRCTCSGRGVGAPDIQTHL